MIRKFFICLLLISSYFSLYAENRSKKSVASSLKDVIISEVKTAGTFCLGAGVGAGVSRGYHLFLRKYNRFMQDVGCHELVVRGNGFGQWLIGLYLATLCKELLIDPIVASSLQDGRKKLAYILGAFFGALYIDSKYN